AFAASTHEMASVVLRPSLALGIPSSAFRFPEALDAHETLGGTGRLLARNDRCRQRGSSQHLVDQLRYRFLRDPGAVPLQLPGGKLRRRHVDAVRVAARLRNP